MTGLDCNGLGLVEGRIREVKIAVRDFQPETKKRKNQTGQGRRKKVRADGTLRVIGHSLSSQSKPLKPPSAKFRALKPNPTP